ncbi:MAG: hypothetical protein JSV91_09075 [Phycisphaerales bacterium]|nr:MAG: hypothetical protein JSV91_09075 [Phycisphaerales bacterium]
MRGLIACFGPRGLLVAVWPLLVCCAATAQQPGGPGELSSLRRAVGHFDFEESVRTPLEMPLYFHRHIDVNDGFPPFGRMRPSNEHAAGGEWSFLFELDGGSMAARIPTAVLPILPLADYLVAVKVRTEGLNHAAARLAVWLHDARGNPIPASLAVSPLVRTEGQWQTISAEVRGVFEQATDLAIELQLLQPRKFGSGEFKPDEPVLVDVAGRAWFDDVMIWHLPRIDLTCDAPGNVFIAPHRPTLNIRVRDLLNKPLTARLRVFDLCGREVADRSFPAPRGREPWPFEVPVGRFGWFRAVLDVQAESELVARRWVDFTVLPGGVRRYALSTVGFSVVLPPMPDEVLAVAPELSRRLGASTVLLPVWDASFDEGGASTHRAALKRAIEEILASEQRMIFALNGVPESLSSTLAIRPSQVLDLISRDPESWRPSLADLLLEFGLEVSHWQLGPTGSSEALDHHNFPRAVDDAARALGEFVPRPVIYVPQTAEQTPGADIVLPGRHITVPYHVRPEAIVEYARDWLEKEGDLTVTLDTLPAESYSPRQRTLDLLLRGLYAWRAGLPEVAINAPWSWDEEIAPDPAFCVWRGLSDHLRGRRFAGELDLADGVRCWIVQDADPDDATLIAWSERRTDEPAASIRLLLGDRPVEVGDAFGNRETIARADGLHEITLGEMPLFIDHVNLPLASFRAGLTIDPHFVPAMHKVHERSIVLHNPWEVTISGTIRIHSAGPLHITPHLAEFIIPPGEEARLPIEIITDRSIIAGRKRIDATVNVNADRTYQLDLHTNIEIGLENIELVAAYQSVPNPLTGADDLVISQYVTNTADRRLNLTVSLLAPGVSQRRRDVAALDPGQTAVRTFRIEGGVELLSGQSIRLGVSERDGIARLNQLLDIPDLAGSQQAASAVTEQ